MPTAKLIDLLTPYRTISIIGMAKNVGKTTTMNHLIKEFAKNDTALALTSIGRDGEITDIVTNTKKPEIFVFKGTIIATTEKLLGFSDISKEIICTTQVNTALGQVVIVRAQSDGHVQLGGPSITAQLSQLLIDISQLGVEKTLVDGALSRKSLANPQVTAATILCTGASVHPESQTVIDEAAHFVKMLTLPPVTDSNILKAIIASSEEKIVKNDDFIYVSGALTDAYVSGLIMSNYPLKAVKLIADDASKIFIKPATYEKLEIKGAKLMVLKAINLVALTINPTAPSGIDFDSEEFLDKFRKRLHIPVFNCQR